MDMTEMEIGHLRKSDKRARGSKQPFPVCGTAV